jgi:hypothetical protein
MELQPESAGTQLSNDQWNTLIAQLRADFARADIKQSSMPRVNTENETTGPDLKVVSFTLPVDAAYYAAAEALLSGLGRSQSLPASWNVSKIDNEHLYISVIEPPDLIGRFYVGELLEKLTPAMARDLVKKSQDSAIAGLVPLREALKGQER